jgi:hypothetical protein
LALIAEKVFGGKGHQPAHALAVYEANIKDVIATIPKDRLLVHCLRDGWEPLCRHLDAPVPEQPYPSRNAADMFTISTPGH